jgi:hypothetical protein
MPSKIREEYNYELVEGVISNYWEIKRSEAFDVSRKLSDLSNENDTSNILSQIQNYMLNVLKSNPQNTFLIDDIKSVEISKQEHNTGMKNDLIFDELCLKIIR